MKLYSEISNALIFRKLFFNPAVLIHTFKYRKVLVHIANHDWHSASSSIAKLSHEFFSDNPEYYLLKQRVAEHTNDGVLARDSKQKALALIASCGRYCYDEKAYLVAHACRLTDSLEYIKLKNVDRMLLLNHPNVNHPDYSKFTTVL